MKNVSRGVRRSRPEPAPAGVAAMDRWLAGLARSAPPLRRLLHQPFNEQLRLGYGHTLREVCQQPLTWPATARRMSREKAALEKLLGETGIGNGRRDGAVVLTGSGSSVFIGECLALPLQASLGVAVQAHATGLLLTHANACLLPGHPTLVVSFGRSGDSPESAAAIALLLREDRGSRHLVVTCNRAGRLATAFRSEPRVTTAVLDDRTHDRSLVMTSSFTNMWLAARFLGMLDRPRAYARLAARLASLGTHVLAAQSDGLARVARTRFRSALFLGTAARHGAAREAALKMLEMTAGRVSASAESFLGLRHGPLSGVRPDTLVVAFLASDPVVRGFECDLIHELRRKRAGGAKVLVGEGVPRELVSGGDLVVDCRGLRALGDENAAPVDVLVGQLLGFFRSLELGLRPDNPSPSGAIQRVVQGFAIHQRDARG